MNIKFTDEALKFVKEKAGKALVINYRKMASSCCYITADLSCIWMGLNEVDKRDELVFVTVKDSVPIYASREIYDYLKENPILIEKKGSGILSYLSIKGGERIALEQAKDKFLINSNHR